MLFLLWKDSGYLSVQKEEIGGWLGTSILKTVGIRWKFQHPQNLKIYVSFDTVFPLLVILDHINQDMDIRIFTQVLFSIAKEDKQKTNPYSSTGACHIHHPVDH